MIAMLKKLVSGLTHAEETSSLDEGELRLATAALLVEAAVMDGAFDNNERDAIERILGARFALSEEEISTLIGDAEKAVEDSNQLYAFTRIIKDRVPHEARTEIVGMLWEVAFADGQLHDYEASLVRRVSGLINVPDRESGAARKQAMRRLGL